MCKSFELSRERASHENYFRPARIEAKVIMMAAPQFRRSSIVRSVQGGATPSTKRSSMAKKKGRKVSSIKGGGSDGIPTAGVEEEMAMGVDDDDGPEDVVKGNDAAAVTSSGTKANGWVLARVLDPSSYSEPATVCRTDGCEKPAVDVWTKNTAPPNGADEIPLCEECEAALAGGSDEQANNATFADTIVSSPEQPEAPTENEEQKNHVHEEDREEAKEGVEEVWELQRILSIKDITESATMCSNPMCKTSAACVYVSNLSPGDEWFSCLDCQVRSDSRTCPCSHPSPRSPHLALHLRPLDRTKSSAASLPSKSSRCRA
jgi:hypothetical protein